MVTGSAPTLVSLLLTLSLAGYACCAEGASEPAPIPAASIDSLQKTLVSLKGARRSTTSRRRVLKEIIRGSEALLRAQPDAPNRFKLLALVLNAQRYLVPLEKTQRNLDGFYRTCEALAKAPDQYIGYRLSAELLLSERDLAAKDADANERRDALAAMAAKYRDTPAELDCLMRIIDRAPGLGAPGLALKDQLMESLARRFAGNAKAIAFRRKLLSKASLEVIFSGRFERVEGSPIVFPHDRLGHPYYVVFWSKDSPAAINSLKQLKEEQDKSPGVAEVYSLNIDELADGGKSVLASIGLKCTALRLPSGNESEAYRTYAMSHPTAVRVNHLGFAHLPWKDPDQEEEAAAGPDKVRSHGAGKVNEFSYPADEHYKTGIQAYDRYAAQLQYLFSGDFLAEPEDKAIQACFVKPPMRYRLSRAEALANYRTAARLSTEAIARSKSTPDSWKLQNAKILALMGMANLTGSADSFEQAVAESRKVLTQDLPQGADVPARFCLAISALREQVLPPKTVLETFVADCGGKKAGPAAYGAACVLAMGANARDLYKQYRTQVLAADVPSPNLDALTAFLRDRYHQFYLFKSSPLFKSYTRLYRFVETRHLIDNSLTPMKDPLPPFEVKTLDGKTLSLPDTGADKLTVLVFVEFPAGEDRLASQILSPGAKPTNKNPNPYPGGELGNALGVERIHVNKGVRVIPVFLSDDQEQVKAICQKHGLNGTVTMLPGGLANPIVNRLGLLSADRSANVMLIRRDGTVAWRKHGLPYQMMGAGGRYVATNGLRHHIDACDAEAGYRALKAKDYKLALKRFAETPKGIHKWTPSFAHGRALAHLGLKDYDAALKEIEYGWGKILACHGGHKVRVWAFQYSADKPCSSMLHMLRTKAKILDHLGRKSEARTARNRIAEGATDYPSHYFDVKGFHRPYEAFEDRMSLVAKNIK